MANKNKINVLVDRLGKNINFRRTKDKEELIKLLSEYGKIREIKKLKGNLNFVSSILDSKKILNPILAEFDTIVEEDYQKFANSVSLKEEVEAFVKLQALQKELARLISLKDIANKSTVAVGGGFSAGKSQFISSFFADDKIKLPIGVKPVTAIASYIINGDKNIIKGYTYNSGIVDIPIDIYVRLSHDFIKELGFNLKTILPMIAMSTCIPDYKHICFVDTPGYNPSNSGYTNEDFNTATEYLTNSNALIWLVGLDTNGTIPQSDLKFLDQLNLDNKELYIVANKADLKSNSELEEILDQFEEVLDEYGLNYEGISAYDSIKKMEKSFRKQNLQDFLNTVDRDIVSKEKLANELYSIFQSYKDALDSEKVKNDNVKKLLHSLELDIMETGREVDDQIDERLSLLNSFFKVKDIEQSLKDLYELKDKMFDSLNKIFIEVFGTPLDKIPDLEYNKKNEEIEITHKKRDNDTNNNSQINDNIVNDTIYTAFPFFADTIDVDSQSNNSTYDDDDDFEDDDYDDDDDFEDDDYDDDDDFEDDDYDDDDDFEDDDYDDDDDFEDDDYDDDDDFEDDDYDDDDDFDDDDYDDDDDFDDDDYDDDDDFDDDDYDDDDDFDDDDYDDDDDFDDDDYDDDDDFDDDDYDD